MNVNDPTELAERIQALEGDDAEGKRLLESARPGSRAARAIEQAIERDRAELRMLRRHRDALERPAKQKRAAAELLETRRGLRREAEQLGRAAREKAFAARDRIIAIAAERVPGVEGQASEVETLNYLQRLSEDGWVALAADAGVAELGRIPTLVLGVLSQRARKQGKPSRGDERGNRG